MIDDGEEADSTQIERMELVGGALCLDFVNTVEGREGPELHDFIDGMADLMTWARRAGVLSEEEAGYSRGSQEALERVLRLREVVYRVFTAIARGIEPGASDVANLGEAYAASLRDAGLRPANDGGIWEWSWGGSVASIDLLTWRIAHSAVDLLRSGQLDRLKQCPGGGATPCNWLFLDTTKGRNRKWCSMADCGGRAKWRRQNERRRGTRLSTPRSAD